MLSDVVGIDIDGYELRVIYECVRYANNDAMDYLLESMRYRGAFTPEEIKHIESVAIDTDKLLDKLEKYIA